MELLWRDHYPNLSALYRDLDTNLELVKDAYQADGIVSGCHRGCDACCRQLVMATRLEAEYAAQSIRKLPKPVRERLWQSLAAWYAAVRPLLAESPQDEAGWDDFAERYRALDVPCPFLSNGACAIYGVRSVACRMLYALDPTGCAQPGGEIDQMGWFEEACDPAMEYLAAKSEAGIFPLMVASLLAP